MKVKIAKWGNSLAVRLPKKLAEELGLAPGKTVELERRDLSLRSKRRLCRGSPITELAQTKPGDKPPPFEDWVFCHQSGPMKIGAL
jgi:antitoxin MazE